MKNKIEDLRNHLFETIERLKDDESPMDLDRAKTISEVSQTIINSAKVEVEFLKVTGGTKDTGFITNEKPTLTPVQNSGEIGRATNERH